MVKKAKSAAPAASFKFGTLNAKDLGSPWVHFFLYGPTGSGKTTAASTFPNPVFLVPKNENSVMTLKGRNVPYYLVVDMDRTPLNLVTGEGSLKHILDHLEKGYNLNPSKFPFDTIVIESLSHYADLVIEQLTAGGAPMNQQRWGIFLAHFRNVQARLRNLEVHAVFTALDQTREDEASGISIGGPLIPGASAKKLPSSCDVIGFCEEAPGKGRNEYRIHFRPHKCYIARSRISSIPPMITNFTFAKIEKFLQGDEETEE